MKTFIFRRTTFRLISVILFTMVAGLAFSQEEQSCAEKLKSAQTNFSKGQIEQIPALLTGCLKSGFKKEEELAAFKLLIQTYLLDDKLDQADSVMLVFLKRNPEYKISPTDHSSFVYLYNNFKVKSLLMMSFRIGTSLPFLTFIEEHPVSGAPGSSEYSSNAANLFFAVEAKYSLTKRLEIGAGFGYSTLEFSNDLEFNDDVHFPNFAHISYKETQQRLEIPVFVNYDLTNTAKFIPYIHGGVGVALNLSTDADATLENDPGSKQSNRTGETLKRNDSRAAVDFFAEAGAGIKYKIQKGFLFAEARSNVGLIQQYTPGGSTADVLQNKYLWSDPGFRLNSVNLSMGITIIFYKPSKKAGIK